MRKPDDKLIDAILSSPTPQYKRPTLLSTSSSSSSPSLRDPVASTFDPFHEAKPSQLRNSRDWDDALQYLSPSSSLSRGRRRTISAAHLASSQKKGCCGDYCHIETNALAASRMDGKKAFGSRRLPPRQAPSPLVVTESDVRHRSSVYTATAAAAAFLESRVSDDSLRFEPRVGNRGAGSSADARQKPSSPQKQQLEATALSQCSIPFKLIAQTRAEKPLVDLFARRYRNGEDGDYLAEEYYGDGEPLGQTFPGYYYQEVQVCSNCFAFYTLVEGVRMKAQNHMARKRAGGGRRSRAKGGGRALESSHLLDASVPRPSQWAEHIAEADERDDVDDPDDDRAKQRLRIWSQTWRHAGSVLQSITKNDAAELYSFTNPHPAVAMVLSCLGIVLLGREGDWTELKRTVSQEKLLALLQRFELAHLSLETVAKAAAHARNPLFSPMHITPISSILTVLQAYAWRHCDAFKDHDANRVLRTLKPELLPAGMSDPSDFVRRAIQEQQMTRLAAPSGLADAVASGGGADAVFTCQDGVTQIPYSVAGQAAGESLKCNLVVFHDFFDTMDSTKVFFRPVLARNVGARALFFNFPGQAGSAYAAGERGTERAVLNNVWQARRVHELLNYLEHTKQFLLTGAPFHLVGFGNGANIAACYTILHGKAYDTHLQSLVLCNGFASVDAQLAAILHSAVNVFSCFPPARPDLPMSFFAKFLFSDAYLAKVDANLALSIYTAVTNAITLDGRVRICKGALRHVDLAGQLEAIDVPLVLVQSVENALVAPTNVDPFLQSRASVLHAWSHQQAPAQAPAGDVRGKTSKQLRQALATPRSAFVSWLRAGHELRQECKAYVAELMDLLVNSKEPLASSGAEHEAGRAPPTVSATPVGDCLSPPQTRVSPSAAAGRPSLVPAAPLIDNATGNAVAAQLLTPQATGKTKAAYKLQLERSEREFQEAVKTHEAQKAELVNKRRLAGQPASEAAHSLSPQPTPAAASSPHANRKFELSAPPPTLTSVRLPHSDAAQPPVLSTGKLHTVAEVNAMSLHSDVGTMRRRLIESEATAAREAAELRAKQHAAAAERLAALQQEQERRRREWEAEDRARAAAFEKKLQEEQAARLAALNSRDAELLAADRAASLAATTDDAPRAPVSAFALRLEQQKQQQRQQQQQQGASPSSSLSSDALPSVFGALEADARATTRLGLLRVDEFADVRASMGRAHRDGVVAHESAARTNARRRQHAHATCIQKHVRRLLATQRVRALRTRVQKERIARVAGAHIVRVVRGFLGRRRFAQRRALQAVEQQRAFAAVVVQRLFRGHVCRVAFARRRRAAKALVLQRVVRGHAGRVRCEALREARAQRAYLDRKAAKLQATWRMYVARDRFLAARFAVLAATEIQRVYRGRLGRREASRKKQWRDAEPGPARLALGLQLIEGSKQAFERQQRELDALHRAQEAAERQVSAVHAELQDSETELAGLERELQEIDQLESDLRELTHEAEMLHSGGIEALLRGGAEQLLESKASLQKRQAAAYAVEMAVQIKRAERERRKQELEAEFAGVFADVQQKRRALARLEEALADMEAARARKDREFARLQRRLVELLEEQKLELERLREKGIELEAATATSAAAAAVTAAKAQEHEARSQAMFASTEELMKFQFMSMSLSYFSSLSMLKSLRDINADTTAAAITSTAESAAAAAAAAAAANLPAVSRLPVGGADLMAAAAAQRKQQELARELADEAAAARRAQLQPLPPAVRDWSVDDVGRWLDALALPQYKPAFAEGAVDGEFLLELRPEDLADVLGVRHALHVRKLVVARNKLLPLTAHERAQLSAVQHEEGAELARARAAVPDLDTVFSQARNGRLKRLAESLDAGFSVDEEDEKGNTLLLIACQNVNVKMVELLVAKRANVNHRNAQGNTPLHFAMAYDADGALGEYLIARGADDTLENAFGLTPYDGLTPE
ncbi:hypothetical protein PybrP1_007720 [[Pythium] brassicae (nom. inval.)]|nr:hypothetical protein PybrP1_007720 [[Pythium] brassicae (nom. inval.)]